jgi:hypothetical protein
VNAMWQEHPTLTGLHRLQIDGRTVAAIVRGNEPLIGGLEIASITAVDRRGAETTFTSFGDTLEENKRTALDFLRAEGYKL